MVLGISFRRGLFRNNSLLITTEFTETDRKSVVIITINNTSADSSWTKKKVLVEFTLPRSTALLADDHIIMVFRLL
jgi:hypothetical protein